jgi:hypothetical protein
MSEIKVNKISPRTACGTTTLGDSGDTFTIPAGVSITNNGTASGFGATGAVSWNTTVKTSTFTAVAGEGYFVNTTGGAVTVNLPAGTAGAVVGIKDYANTFDTNNVTVAPNGSDKIGGSTTDAVLSTEGIALTLVFIDSTQGWLVTDSGLQSEIPQPSYITATGGTILTCGNFKTHVFTGPGTFCVSAVGNCAGSTTVEYMVVAGGGSGGNRIGGGGGAGGFRQNFPSPGTGGLPVSVTGYPITVGGGGSGIPDGTSTWGYGPNGSNSIFSTITSAGGGAAGPGGTPEPAGNSPGQAGGSGGGGAYFKPSTGGAGNTPPVSPPQGNTGGSAPTGPGVNSGGGGGGAGATGSDGSGPESGPGGIGSNIPDAFFGPTAPSYGTAGPAGSTRYFAGGGSGGGQQGYTTVESAGTPTVGGGGSGRVDASKYDAVVNTGGGGGGGGLNSLGSSGGGGLGGSGIVVIRYKFQ